MKPLSFDYTYKLFAIDDDDYLFITGRKKRFVKLYGKRMSLDQIQDDLQEAWDTPDIVCTGDDASGIRVWMTAQAAAGIGTAVEAEDQLLQMFWERWGIRENMIHIRVIDAIPRNSSGKITYAALPQEE